MKRFVWTSRLVAAWVLSVIPAVVFAAPHAAGGEHGGHGGGGCADMEWVALQPDEQGRVGFLWVIVNFVVLMLVLNKLLFSKLRAGHARDRERIKGELERATEAREKAEALLDKYKAKLDKLEDEVKEIKDSARTTAEAEKKKILEGAKADAEKIKAGATTAAELESERRRKELEGEIVDRAVEAAEKAIRAQFGAADQRKMVDDYVGEVAQVDLQEGRA
jgi:F-type H+-transporting ATPase subunit b